MKTPQTLTILLILIIIGSGCAHRGADDSLSYIQEFDRTPEANATTLIVKW